MLVPVPALAVVVVARRVNRAVGGEHGRVLVAGRDGDDGAGQSGQHRVVGLSGVCIPKGKLSIAILPARPDASVFLRGLALLGLRRAEGVRWKDK